MKGKFSIAMSLAVILALLLTSLALADQIVNNIDGTVDATFEVLSLNTGGPNGSVGLYVVTTDGDGHSGCNFQGHETLVVSVNSSNSSVATVSPSSVTFGSCGDIITLTVIPGSTGSTNITLSQTSNNTGDTFSLNTASFTVNVAPPPNTPPVVSVTGVAAGSNYEFGSVPSAGCSVNDAEDGLQTVSPVMGDLTGPLADYDLGSQEVTCSYTDTGGLTTTASVTYSIVDTTAPMIASHDEITVEATDPDGAIVDYDSPATNDAVFGDDVATCAPASGTQFALGNTTVFCNYIDGAGNAAAQTSFVVHVVDTTPPDVVCDSADADWHADNQTVSCTATDLVGPLSQTVTLSTSVAAGTETDSANTNSLQVCDAANNCTTAGPVGPFKIDRKAPALSSCDSPDSLWHNSNVTLNCYYADGGSGAGDLTVALTTSVTAGTEDANAAASAGGAQSCDAVGNCADSPTDIGGNMVDMKVPQFSSCDSPDGTWHANDVTLYCHYTDGGSGPATQDVALSTSVAAGTETNNASASANGAHACDDVNNCAASPADIAGNMVDKKAPTITITAPTSGTYLLNQAVAANFNCGDGGSGVASCTGTVANGNNIDTSSVGSKNFAVNATDNVGNTASPLSLTYTVQYATGGTCYGGLSHAILQPINTDGSSVFKQKSTVPAKFRVCDANGNSIGTPGVVTSFRLVQTISGTAVSGVNEPVDSTTPDTAFRWSASDQLWIFNVNTKNLSANVTYYYDITLNDGSHIYFHFGLK